MTHEEFNLVDEYFTQLLTRYWNMYNDGIDDIGYKRTLQMVEDYTTTGHITPQEFQYIFNRTHPHGDFPRYMTHPRFKRYGEVPPCPVQPLIRYIVDWRVPSQHIQEELARQITNFKELKNG
jgi:hypothetical protein